MGCNLSAIFDYDKEGSLIFLKVLGASKRVSETHKIEFQNLEL